MHEISVRAAEPEDAGAVFTIACCPKVRSGTLQMPYQSLTATQLRLEQPQDGLHRLVAELDGEVVGVAGLHLESSPRRRHVGSLGMMVHDDYQGRGVGKALLGAIIDLADNWLNLHRLELQVYTDNAAGVHLYRSYGFSVEGTCIDYAFRDGEYVDAYVMGRLAEQSRQSPDADPDTLMV